MAEDMLEDPAYTPKGNYVPAVVLVSDGEPNDDGWPGSLERFINEGRTRKCQRFAVAIGADADEEMLQKFAQDKDSMFYANNAKSLVDAFRSFPPGPLKCRKRPRLRYHPARRSAARQEKIFRRRREMITLGSKEVFGP